VVLFFWNLCSSLFSLLPVLEYDSPGSVVQIIKLILAQCPEEGRNGTSQEQQG